MNAQLLSAVNQLLALGTILLQIFVVAGLGAALFFKKAFLPLQEKIGKNGIALAFIISLLSTCGSLFYSNVAGFEPCALCWLQRIFMYPLVIILAAALIKKSGQIIDYIIALPVIGLLIALYHNYIYYFAVSGCQFAGKGVSCTQRYVFEFGYITIPLMSLTASVAIILLLLLARKYHAKQ